MPDAAGRCTVGGLSPWNGGILVSCRNIVNLSASRSYMFSPFQHMPIDHRAVPPRPNRHHVVRMANTVVGFSYLIGRDLPARLCQLLELTESFMEKRFDLPKVLVSRHPADDVAPNAPAASPPRHNKRPLQT